MSPLDEINTLLNDVIDKLTAASELVVDAPLEPSVENTRKLSTAVGQVFEVQMMVYKARPDLAGS